MVATWILSAGVYVEYMAEPVCEWYEEIIGGV